MLDDQLRIAVIVASTRQGRLAPVVTGWFTAELAALEKVDIDVVDLAETPLPPTQAAKPAFLGGYESALVRDFAARIDAADAFVVVTPEYNHGYPAALKHALDAVYREWKAKPVAFVSYGGIAGGVRAVEQLRAVFAELHTVTIRNTVSFAMVRSCFDDEGRPRDRDGVGKAAATMIAELLWWAEAAREARTTNPFPV